MNLDFEVVAISELSVYRVAGLVLARVIYTEVEVHTVYKTLFKKGDKGLHPMQHIPSYELCPETKSKKGCVR